MQFLRLSTCAMSALLALSPSTSHAAKSAPFDLIETVGKCPSVSSTVTETQTQRGAYDCIGGAITEAETKLDKAGSTRAKFIRGSTVTASVGLLGLVFGAANVGGTTLKVWAATAILPGMWNDLASPRNARVFMLSGAQALGQVRERYKAM